MIARLRCICAAVLLTALTITPAFAQNLPLITTAAQEDGGSVYSLSLQALFGITLLALLPAILMTTTAFTRIVVVLAILRQGLGTQQTPSNQVLLGLALFLTLFIMMPVFNTAWERGIAPYMAEELALEEAVQEVITPFRGFMMTQTREADIAMFTELAGNDLPDTAEEVPLRILVPAFITSELKTAFQIGFLILLPFLIIDLVVASVLMSMGMVMLSPLIISLPFKLMLFVLVDGWSLMINTMAASFYVA